MIAFSRMDSDSNLSHWKTAFTPTKRPNKKSLLYLIILFKQKLFVNCKFFIKLIQECAYLTRLSALKLPLPLHLKKYLEETLHTV